MSEEGFPLPASSYQELTKIIKAYGHLTQPAELSEVSKLTAMHTTNISANNAFLLAVGVIEGGKKKSISSKGRDLSLALEHDMPGDIAKYWRSIVTTNEFLQRLVSAVKIRNGMEAETLHAHVAYSAGQPKRPSVMTGARTVVDILLAAGSLKEVDGKLVASATTEADTATTSTPSSERVAAYERTEVEHMSPKTRITEPNLQTLSRQHHLALNIQIQIQCKPDEITTLGPKLRSLLNELKIEPASMDVKAGEEE